MFGIGIIGSAFLLAWAAEASQSMISSGLAIAIVALLTVLPEYAVSTAFAWKAGTDPALTAYLAGGAFPESLEYPVANVTGSNRLLSGLGWPLVIFLYWLRRRRTVELTPALTPEVTVLGVAGLYSAIMFVRAQIALWDAGILLALFLLYMWLISRVGEGEEADFLGPPRVIAALSPLPRKIVIGLLFAFSGIVIAFVAEPFADGLIETGTSFNIDHFLLVQWVAPLASEAPEILVAAIFTLRGNPVFGIAALVSAAVNQWTLLVGSLPVVFSIAARRALSIPLDARPDAEVFLTMAQVVFAVTIIARLRIGIVAACVLLVAFLANVAIPGTEERYVMGVIFLAMTAIVLVTDRTHALALRDRAVGFFEMVRERATG